jgi:hypothetical protein
MRISPSKPRKSIELPLRLQREQKDGSRELESRQWQTFMGAV